jgi:hypothetical protein
MVRKTAKLSDSSAKRVTMVEMVEMVEMVKTEAWGR